MDLDSAMQSIKNEFPNKAMDLAESLELLKEVISDTMNAINNKSNDSFHKRDFQTRRQYDELALFVYDYEQLIDQFINKLNVDSVEFIDDEDADEEAERKTIPNYADYLVDHNVEHTLYENFTHKRPFAFKINDQQIIEVNTWQKMLLKTAELLFAIDTEKFLSFEHAPGMNGKKVKYISSSPDGMRRPQPILDRVFIETNMSGNSIRNLIVKMIKAYGFKPSDYKVYFRADYTELNQE